MKVDRFSTHVTASFSECGLDLEIEARPCDENLLLSHSMGPKTFGTMCEAIASTHREMGSGG